MEKIQIYPKKTVLLLVIFLFTWLSSATGDTGKPKTGKTKVEVIQLKPRILKNYSAYIGHLNPFSRVIISSELAGIVEKVNVDIGSTVKSGNVLAEIDTKRLLLNKLLNQSNYKLALDEYEREKKLFDKNLSTSAIVSTLKNKLEVSKLKLDLSNLDLMQSKVKAPISGIVKGKQIEEGEYVKVGTELIELFDISKVIAIIHIPERDIRYISPGKRALISVDALPNVSFVGTIKSKALEADLKSRSFEIEVLIDNPDRILLPGMLVRVSMLKVHLKNQVIIPRHTIQEGEMGSFVYIVNSTKVIKREVKIGLSIDDEVQVISGLKFNDFLVNSGHQLISPNEIVEIINRSIQE
ncbi:efflux RND transporter periplasmic adaptor subunit [bacterium]|nr:efflux RND transporter periplasmic adaptor subunit [bacterium]